MATELPMLGCRLTPVVTLSHRWSQLSEQRGCSCQVTNGPYAVHALTTCSIHKHPSSTGRATDRPAAAAHRQPELMYARAAADTPLGEIADRQLGVVRRSQLAEVGVDADGVAAQVTAERWGPYGTRVVVLQNAPMTRQQHMWAAVLHGGRHAALASTTALESSGLLGFESPLLHIVVPRGTEVPPMPGLKVHESRRFVTTDVHPARRPPQTRNARSAVDAGAWNHTGRFACAILAASVQQRLTTVPLLREVLDAAGAIRHRRLMLAALDDIGGGAQALSELDVAKLCRRAGLACPDRQRVRRDRAGRRRYLDCEWTLCNGTVVVLEVDGAHHMSVEHWWRDMERERQVVLSGRVVLRCSSVELKAEPQAIVRDLRAAGVLLTSRRTRQLSGA